MSEEPDPRDMEWSVEMVKTTDGRLWIKTRRREDASVQWEEYPDAMAKPMIIALEASGIV